MEADEGGRHQAFFSGYHPQNAMKLLFQTSHFVVPTTFPVLMSNFKRSLIDRKSTSCTFL
jgi:translation elongation factor EF-Tu-like GTPase